MSHEPRLDVRAVDLRAELVELVCDGGVVRLHRRSEACRAQPQPEPAVAADDREAAAPIRSGSHRSRPVRLDAELLRADPKSVCAGAEDDRDALQAGVARPEAGDCLSRRQAAHADAVDRDPLRELPRRPREAEAECQRRRHDHAQRSDEAGVPRANRGVPPPDARLRRSFPGAQGEAMVATGPRGPLSRAFEGGTSLCSWTSS